MNIAYWRAPGRWRADRIIGRMLRQAAVLLACGVVFTPSIAARAEPVTLTVRPVALNPRDPTQATVGFLTYRGGIEIASPDGRFGGLSGLVGTPSGDLISISDRGFWLIARLVLDERGYLVGITDGEMGRLAGPGGVPGGGPQQEAEDSAPLPDRTPVASFAHD